MQVVLGAEIAIGILWTVAAAMAQGAGGLAVVGLFFLVYALYAAFFLFAAWVFWRHPAQRKIAGWIMALPILFWFLPQIIRAMSGGALSAEQFAVACIVLLVAAFVVCWFAPRKAAIVIPDFLVRSRLFNWLLLLSVLAGWLFLVLAVAYVANADGPRSTDSSEGLGLAIIMAAIYLLWLGVGSFGAATWAWVSLRGGIAGTTRKLNIAQLVVATPGVLSGIAVAFWVAGQARL